MASQDVKQPVKWGKALPTDHVLFADVSGTECEDSSLLTPNHNTGRNVTISPHSSGDPTLCHRWHRQGGRGDWKRYVCAYSRIQVKKKSIRVCLRASCYVCGRKLAAIYNCQECAASLKRNVNTGQVEMINAKHTCVPGDKDKLAHYAVVDIEKWQDLAKRQLTPKQAVNELILDPGSSQKNEYIESEI